MSAMLESYDMQMLDYSGDLDIQMHPSSEQWFPDEPDEANMEEDGPTLLKPEIYPHSKNEAHLPIKTDSYTQEKSDITIEVDMEASAEHQNVEYDMLDADEMIRESGTEILDVEVYDVSLGESPSIPTFHIAHEQSSDTLNSFEHPTSNNPLPKGSPTGSSIPFSDLPLQSLETQVLEPAAGDSISLPLADEALAYEPPSEAVVDVAGTPQFAEPNQLQESEADPLEHHEVQSQHYLTENEAILPLDQTTELVEHLHAIEPVEGDGSRSQVDPREDATEDNSVQDQVQEKQTELGDISASAHTLGDPHEISEGVYIDPPPPVLLSITSEDQFDFSLFNGSPDWTTDSESHPDDRVILHHLPTLYYEPLSTVFDALRREDFMQSLFDMAESELVLEAVDLQLTVSEDNIYAVDVSLHDLNVLHDVSGIGGLLRIRLYATAPRFITRYRYLQEQVSRLHLDQPTGEVHTEPTTEAEASHEESQEAEPIYEAEQHYEGDSDNSSKTGEISSDAQVRDNKDDPHPDDGLSDALAVKSYIELSHLPSLPEDQLEENEQQQQHNDIEQVKTPSPKDDHDDPTSDNKNLSSSDRSSTAEVENQVVNSFSNNHDAEGDEGDTIALEALEASNENDSYTEEDHPNAPHDSLQYDNFSNDAEDYDNSEGVHIGAEEQEVVQKFDPVDSAGEMTSASPLLAKALDNAILEEGTDDDDDIYGLEGKVDLAPNLELGENVEGVVALENFSNTEDQENFEHVAVNDKNLTSVANPIAFEEENWEDDLDGDGELDATWEDENENTLSQSNHSSVTLSSKASKRSFGEFESGGDLQDDGDGHWTPPSSPDPKRSRIQ